jgi:methionyl-tRNA formyltransferase
MRIVLIGTVLFSREMLLQLFSIGANVVGICTAEGGHLNADFADLQPLGEAKGIPILRCNDINADEPLEWIRNLRPDVIFCFGWSRLIGSALLALPPKGVVGYHPAALPANRGRHPIIWALALGLEKTASSFFLMNADADGGDLLSQEPITIEPDDDAGTLYQKIVSMAREQLAELVPALAAGQVPSRRQDASAANVWRKRGVADGRIDWRMSASCIHNLVRALARPYPGAEISTANGPIKLWRTRVVADAPSNAEPGKVLFHLAGKPIVRCGDQAICLLETEPPFAPAPGTYL